MLCSPSGATSFKEYPGKEISHRVGCITNGACEKVSFSRIPNLIVGSIHHVLSRSCLGKRNNTWGFDALITLPFINHKITVTKFVQRGRMGIKAGVFN